MRCRGEAGVHGVGLHQHAYSFGCLQTCRLVDRRRSDQEDVLDATALQHAHHQPQIGGILVQGNMLTAGVPMCVWGTFLT